MFSVENDVFYKKAKNAFDYIRWQEIVDIRKNTNKFLDFNFSDDYLEVVSKNYL